MARTHKTAGWGWVGVRKRGCGDESEFVSQRAARQAVSAREVRGAHGDAVLNQGPGATGRSAIVDLPPERIGAGHGAAGRGAQARIWRETMYQPLHSPYIHGHRLAWKGGNMG
jgi:hypothetical protein